MKWGLILAATALAIGMIWFQWPKMRHYPKKDKAAFLVLLLIGWVLSLFDLPNLPGPTSWISSLFRPWAKLLE